MELRHDGVGGELRGLGVHLPGNAQHVDEQIAHQRRGDIVEHDRRDDDVGVALGLEIAGNGGERGAEQGAREDRDDDERRTGQEGQIKRGERRAEARDIGLPLDADIEEPSVKTDRDRKAGENKACRIIEREADAFEVAERADDENLHRLDRVLADGEHDKPGNEECGGDIEQRDQRDVGPDGEGF